MAEWNPDPQISYFGHPVLFAGYNSCDNDGDEVDGPGVNAPQWPVYVDTFIGFSLIVLTTEMLEAFDSQCPDYVAAAVPELYVAQPDNWEVGVGNLWPDPFIAAEADVVTIEPQSDSLVLAADWPDYLVTPINGTRQIRSTP